MDQLSDRLNRLSVSQTLAMSQKSGELRAQGVDVINLSVGEPDFNTPQHIKDAAIKAVEDNFSHYSPVAGYPALKNAIVAKLKNENELNYSASQICVSNGAKQSVCNALMCVVGQGDEVIIPAPYWVSYPEMVKLADGTPVIVSAGIEQNFKITPQQLEAAITPKTRAFVLCSPSNPTGSVYSKEELAGLVAVLARYPRIIIIADEIYEHINYIGQYHGIGQFPEVFDRTVVVNGVSKAYAMTGWRIGFAAGPEWIIKGCNKLQGADGFAVVCRAMTGAETQATVSASAETNEMLRMRNPTPRRNYNWLH
jgi:aspartate aminotransferase